MTKPADSTKGILSAILTLCAVALVACQAQVPPAANEKSNCVSNADCGAASSPLPEEQNFIQTLQAILTGVPADYSMEAVLNITVSGMGITSYKYKVGPESIDCANASAYSESKEVAWKIADDLSGLADGGVKVCVIGSNGPGKLQPLAKATVAKWIKGASAGSAPRLDDLTAQIYALNSAISPLSFSNTGAAVTACSISPALPTGMAIAVASSTCQISGTPSAATAATSYQVTAKSSNGLTASATVSLTISAAALVPPALENLVAQSFTVNTPITPLTFVNVGSPAISCNVAPSLPSGLSLSVSGSSCQISGTPLASSANATYIITAAATDTSTDTATVDIAVTSVVPPIIANQSAQSYLVNVAIPALAFVNTGAPATGCAVSPTLPAGLAVGVNSSTCRITGTPAAVSSAATYTVVATAADASTAIATVSITIVAPAPPDLTNQSAKTFTTNVVISPFSFVNAGSAATSCSSSPTLPAGLVVAVSAGTCQVSGAPTAVVATTIFTITATAADASTDTATVSITTDSPTSAGKLYRITNVNMIHNYGEKDPLTENFVSDTTAVHSDAWGNILYSTSFGSFAVICYEATNAPYCIGKTIGKSTLIIGEKYDGEFDGATNIAVNQAGIGRITSVWSDASSNVYLADYMYKKIRVLCYTNADGFCAGKVVNRIYTVTGTGVSGDATNASVASSGTIGVPRDVVSDSLGNIFISDGTYGRILVVCVDVSASSLACTGKTAGNIYFLGGNGALASDGATDSVATSIGIGSPRQMAIRNSNIYFVERTYNRVRVICLKTDASDICSGKTAGKHYRIVGGSTTDAADAAAVPAVTTAFGLGNPEGIAVDSANNIYLGDAKWRHDQRCSRE